jgi:flagellar motor switch protein FliN/FliY
MADDDDDDDDGKESQEAIYNVDVDISVVLGQSNLRVNQLLKLGRGAVVELEQRTSDPVEIFANDVLIARGEVVITAGDKIGVTLTELVKSIYNNNA